MPADEAGIHSTKEAFYKMTTIRQSMNARLGALYARLTTLRTAARNRRMAAVSGHLQEIIWAVIIVVLGVVAYLFFGNNGAGGQWFHNILNSVTQFTD